MVSFFYDVWLVVFHFCHAWLVIFGFYDRWLVVSHSYDAWLVLLGFCDGCWSVVIAFIVDGLWFCL